MFAGKLTPPAPPILRVDAADASRITVPPKEFTAILPKLRSAFLTMLMGATMVAAASAVAVAFAFENKKKIIC